MRRAFQSSFSVTYTALTLTQPCTCACQESGRVSRCAHTLDVDSTALKAACGGQGSTAGARRWPARHLGILVQERDGLGDLVEAPRKELLTGDRERHGGRVSVLARKAVRCREAGGGGTLSSRTHDPCLCALVAFDRPAAAYCCGKGTAVTYRDLPPSLSSSSTSSTGLTGSVTRKSVGLHTCGRIFCVTPRHSGRWTVVSCGRRMSTGKAQDVPSSALLGVALVAILELENVRVAELERQERSLSLYVRQFLPR